MKTSLKKWIYIYLNTNFLCIFEVIFDIYSETGSSLAGQYAFPLCSGVSDAAVRAHLRGTAREHAAHASNVEAWGVTFRWSGRFPL